MRNLFFLACITFSFCMCLCGCANSSIVDDLVINPDTEVLGFGKVKCSKDGKYFVETDLAKYDVNFVFSANSTTSRKIRICPKDGDGVTIFSMDETIYFIQGTCDKSYLDALWTNNIPALLITALVVIIAYIVIIAFVAALGEALGEKLSDK